MSGVLVVFHCFRYILFSINEKKHVSRHIWRYAIKGSFETTCYALPSGLDNSHIMLFYMFKMNHIS